MGRWRCDRIVQNLTENWSRMVRKPHKFFLFGKWSIFDGFGRWDADVRSGVWDGVVDFFEKTKKMFVFETLPKCIEWRKMNRKWCLNVRNVWKSGFVGVGVVVWEGGVGGEVLVVEILCEENWIFTFFFFETLPKSVELREKRGHRTVKHTFRPRDAPLSVAPDLAERCV